MGACLSALMIKAIMTTRTAALALAVPLFMTAPAIAEKHRAPKHYAPSSYGDPYYGNKANKPWRKQKRQAAKLCRHAISSQAHEIGFRDVDFDDGFYVERTRRGGLRVTFNEVEFEGFRREFEQQMRCVVKHGTVRWIDELPQPRRYRHARFGHYRY